MKKALILGITGTFGHHVALFLQQDGWKIKALMRQPHTLPKDLFDIEVIEGDIENLNPALFDDVELVVYGINPPKYNWKNTALSWLEKTLTIVSAQKLTLIFPGNVYIFNPHKGPDFDERAQIQPVSNLGRIRADMEQRLHIASLEGARIILLRMGNFFSTSLPNSWLSHAIQEKKASYTLTIPGPKNLKHAWTYVPDAAQTLALLVRQKEQLPAFASFHFGGYLLSWQDIADCLTQISAKPVQIKYIPWWLIGTLRLFSVMFQGLYEMRYLWSYPLNLNQDKLKALLGSSLPHTPVEEALKKMLLPTAASFPSEGPGVSSKT